MASYVPGELIFLPSSASIPELPHVAKVEKGRATKFSPENPERHSEIADLYRLNRVAEITGEFNARR